MEFVAFVSCMSIIAQINAAPTPESGLNVPHHDNEFELPAIARAGFEMNLDVEIDEKYHDKLDKMTVILLPNDDQNSEITSKYCGYDNSVSQHTHICILPDELQNKLGQAQSISLQKVRISARLNHEGDGLNMFVFLNGSFTSESHLPLQKFEELKHFSVEGVAGDIQRLQFDFTNQR